MPQKLLFGFTNMQYQGYTIWVAEPEKAILDITYKFGKPSISIKELDNKKILSYAKRMKIKEVIL